MQKMYIVMVNRLQKFVKMEKNREINNKNDVIVKASNFVMEHALEDTFAKHYVLDSNIIGEGAFGRV